jgi:hypothetical protein
LSLGSLELMTDRIGAEGAAPLLITIRFVRRSYNPILPLSRIADVGLRIVLISLGIRNH